MGKLTFLFLVISTSIYGQIKGVVIDENNKSIPYVNIWIENESIGTTSEENGNFSINVEDKNKILVLSALGFETKKIKVSEAEKVVLKEVTFQLDEVAVFSKKGKNEIEIGNYRKGGINLYNSSGKTPRIMAKYFPMTEEIKSARFLKEITLMTACNHHDKAKINLRFFEANEDGGPGNDILEQNIVLNVNSGKKNSKINLEEYNIIFPQKGLFIAVEWLIIEENRYELELTDPKTQKLINWIAYEPSLGAVPSENPTTWEFSKGKWKKSNLKNTDEGMGKYKDKFSELAIKLTLTN
jgi:hypothetical protein